MTDDAAPETEPVPTTEDGIPLVVNGERLSDTQVQALREARARRDEIDARGRLPKEIGGADRAEEPTRYGDWEKAGRAYDFS
jgi:hypothetical protein